MKLLKPISFIFILTILLYACASSPINNKTSIKEKPVVIANDSLEYEITILDIGFNTYLNSIAQPRNYYSQSYLEARNRGWVTTWNMRAQNPNQYNPNIYENVIDYQQHINYGYEVNYLLFNYFLFAQNKYRMNLGGGFTRNRIN
ncbi:DUF6146 family protein [uncultured Polaribacter sp.]|uniref:DUF6146 family protein n=1 Tax=uncultured Polaribacter sp. TaxID=174711 RepID=UPI0026052184|nr:DUF6146 family protein [uncultured Polaribacter sp.]